MTSRDRTARFEELRRLYKPHSIKINDISSYLRSAATSISHRANAKFSKSKFNQRFKIKDPYNSDDSGEGKSLLKHTSAQNNADSDSISSSSDGDNSHEQATKLPLHLVKALQTKPLWMQLLRDIDENIVILEKQC